MKVVVNKHWIVADALETPFWITYFTTLLQERQKEEYSKCLHGVEGEDVSPYLAPKLTASL